MTGRDGGLGRRVATGAGWMVGFRWVDRAIGLCSVAILARLLVPEDFGIAGYAMLVIGLLELFTDLSTDSALIRNQRAAAADYNIAWTLNALRGVALALVLVALAAPAAVFFHEPRLMPIMLVVATIPLVQGIENPGIVDFRKKLEFEREFRFLLIPRVVALAATIGLALWLRDYRALVGGALVRAATRVIASYAMHPLRPRFSLAHASKLVRFSAWMMLQNVAVGLVQRLPALVVGREWSGSALAFFNMSKELADLSSTEIGAPVRRVLYPGIAQIADHDERTRDVLVGATGVLALVALPIPIGIALVAQDLVPLWLGVQWQPSIPLLPPLCIAAAAATLSTNSQLAYMASDRPHLTAITALIRLGLLALLLGAFGREAGLGGIANIVAGVAIAALVIDYLLAARLLHIATRRFLAVIARPVAGVALMCAAVWFLREQFVPATDAAGHLWSLLRSALAGSVVYVVIVWGSWRLAGRPRGAEQRVLELLRERYRRRRHAVARDVR